MARAVATGVPHHVTQRGNNRRDVFSGPQDYMLYLALLREFSVRYHLRIWGYCLMSNHVHLVAVPDAPDAMARTFARAHAEYARHANIRARTSGHFWQARYYSCPLDDSYRWNALAYVERNPVRAGIVAEADAYRWSSARARLHGSDERGLLDLGEWSRVYSSERWRKVLGTSVAEEAILERIREATRTGRPLGAEAFVAGLEREMGRKLLPGKPGRPRVESRAAGVFKGAEPEIGK